MSTWQNNFKGVAYRPVPQAADEQRTSTPLSIPREEDHERPSQGKAKGLFRLYCGACSACLLLVLVGLSISLRHTARLNMHKLLDVMKTAKFPDHPDKAGRVLMSVTPEQAETVILSACGGLGVLHPALAYALHTLPLASSSPSSSSSPLPTCSTTTTTTTTNNNKQQQQQQQTTNNKQQTV